MTVADQPEQEEKEKPKAQASEKKAEPKAEEKPQEKTKEKPEEHPEKKGKKISRMTLAEVDAELKGVQEKMGGFESNFARHLLARKKELSHPTARS